MRLLTAVTILLATTPKERSEGVHPALLTFLTNALDGGWVGEASRGEAR